MLLDKIEIKEEAKLTIEEIRILSGYSQKEFAEKIKIPYSTYVKKENGKTKFLIGEVGNICNKMEVPIEKVLI